jgi:hypothetical protein
MLLQEGKYIVHGLPFRVAFPAQHDVPVLWPILQKLAGQSLRAIAAELDRRGIKSWSGKPSPPAPIGPQRPSRLKRDDATADACMTQVTELRQGKSLDDPSADQAGSEATSTQ